MLLTFCRGVAQLGRALPWGGRGRTFKSCRSDQLNTVNEGFAETRTLLFFVIDHQASP